jgi:hypothetical protein
VKGNKIMEIVNKETLDKIVAGADNIGKVASGVATELTNEAINLFIIESVLSILKFSVVFVIFFIVKKYCDTMSSDSNDKMFRSFKTTAMVLSLIFFTTQSFPHITQICKALVAPKIFLMEKTLSLVK